MSQLYYSSSLISNKRFLSFEQLFEVVSPKDVLIVFDTNVVIYYRDLYLNPTKFIETKKDIYQSIRYLVEQIFRYDLEINASIGVEESCRSKNNFKLNIDKAKQTHQAIMSMFRMDINSFDEHVKKGMKEEEITIEESYSISKMESLREGSSFQHLLIISYLASLKIFLLKEALDRKQITPLKAYLDFMDFMMKEVNCVGGTIFSYALHLFGGVDEFKSILISKGRATAEEKLHRIFNGAIDLIYPYIVNKVQKLFPIPNNSTKLIPVLVTADKRLSMLHSILNTKIIFESSIEKGKVNYNPELIEIGFFYKMKWTEHDMQLFQNKTTDDVDTRMESAMSGQKTASHLLPLVEKYEKATIEIFK